tara:strand:+ start:826 stop:1101 length:276 start_codon:yes stop_codon:yes gene_type:complete
MFNKFILIASIVLVINFSCEEAEEAVKCADASLELVNTLNSFNEYQTSSNCNSLQSAASKYLSNNCSDTSGFGGVDPTFIIDSLNCDILPS